MAAIYFIVVFNLLSLLSVGATKNVTEIPFTISGQVAPVFTPYNEDYSVNYELIPHYLEYLTGKGVHAVLVGGTSGEAECLNVEERMKLAETWVHAARPQNFQVMIQVGGAPLPDVLRLAKHAEEIKADAIMSLPELYFKPKSAEQLVTYLQHVSAAAPSLPLLYYNHPAMSGVKVDLKKLFALASTELPNFKGMKADLNDAIQVQEYLTGDKKVFIANHLIAPAALLGHNSSIASVNNMFPRMVQDILGAIQDSKVEKARVLQEDLIEMVNAVASNGDWVPTMKYAMHLVTGLNVGPTRRPITPLSHEQMEKIQKNLKKINVNLMN